MNDLMFSIFVASQFMVPFLLVILIIVCFKLFKKLSDIGYVIDYINDTTFKIQDESITNSTETLQKVISEVLRQVYSNKNRTRKAVGFNVLKSDVE